MGSEKRILVLIDRYLPILGGAQNNVHQIGQDLQEKGFNITILTRMVQPGLAGYEEIDRIPVRRFGSFPLRVVSKVLGLIQITWYLIKRRKEYDAVVCVPCAYYTDFLPAYFGWLITKKPYILRTTMTNNFDYMLSMKHAVPQDMVKKVLLPPFIWRQALDHSSAVIVQSPLILKRAQMYRAPHTRVIPNGVDNHRFRPAVVGEKEVLRKKLHLPEDKVIVVNTGRYIHEKNQMILIRAVECVVKEHRPGKVHLVLLGAREQNHVASNELELKRYVHDRELDDIVQFFDDALNVEDYLRASDIFVLPTMFDEGMSNSALEAMACGLPIVSSDLPQVKHVFPEEGVRYFDPHDAMGLAMRLIDLVDSEELRNSDGYSMAEYACEHYRRGRIANEYSQVLDRVLTGRSSTQRGP